MLELKGVAKAYGSQRVLGPLSLEIAAAGTTVLIGPSGCGKSTLLRLVLGLVTPSDGEVVFEGRPLALTELPATRRKMGYVIQDGGLFPHLSARDNATLMARHLDWAPARTEARLAELCELTHFPDDGLDRYPLQLSGGQRQRVSLIRALMLDPDLLLLDEPLSALDPMIRSGLQKDLRAVFTALDKTVVLVTHDLAEAAYFADHLVLMQQGRIVQQGTLEELEHSPASEFVTDYLDAQRGALRPSPAS